MKRYIIHSNPIGACDLNLVVTKMDETVSMSFSEKGGNFVTIDKESFPEVKSIQGNYLISINTEDPYCSFYLVGYDTPYQYVKMSQG